jgi:hypothetical protein
MIESMFYISAAAVERGPLKPPFLGQISSYLSSFPFTEVELGHFSIYYTLPAPYATLLVPVLWKKTLSCWENIKDNFLIFCSYSCCFVNDKDSHRRDLTASDPILGREASAVAPPLLPTSYNHSPTSSAANLLVTPRPICCQSPNCSPHPNPSPANLLVTFPHP